MAVNVKGLEWRSVAMMAADNGWLTIRIAETPFGQYRVDKADRHRFRVTLTGQTVANCHPTDDIEATAAAQADYERRILSAIEQEQDTINAEYEINFMDSRKSKPTKPLEVTEEMVERACKALFGSERWPVGFGAAAAIDAQMGMRRALSAALSQDESK
jgi:hypothetical protein